MKFKTIGNELVGTFTFTNFAAALAFINKVGALAEKHNHHPYIENMYNKVILKLSTHDAGNVVTAKDEELAKLIEGLGE
jgi:4a-hydroxytetrahydrobiopterin dehydratase